MYKKTLLKTLFILGVLGINAQQDIQFTNYDFLLPAYNPAALNLKKDICITMIDRTQWMGFSGNPSTFFMNGSYKLSHSGTLGLNFIADKLGFQQQTELKLGYAYPIAFTSGILSLGINLGWTELHINGGFLPPDTPVQDDHAIPNNFMSQHNIETDVGLFYDGKNGIRVGISSTKFIKDAGILTNNVGMVVNRARHYQIFSSYKLRLNKGHIVPSLLAKSDMSSTQLDLQCRYWTDRSVMIGLNYRLAESVSPLVGYQWNLNNGYGLNCFASYDIVYNGLRSHQNGTLEVGVSLCYIKPKFPRLSDHPRWLGGL